MKKRTFIVMAGALIMTGGLVSDAQMAIAQRSGDAPRKLSSEERLENAVQGLQQWVEAAPNLDQQQLRRRIEALRKVNKHRAKLSPASRTWLARQLQKDQAALQ